MNIYERAERNGVSYVANCTAISVQKWEQLMKGATRANKIKVVKMAVKAGVIDADQGRTEIKKPYFNPYNHLKTKTHLIYVHSGIEHFIKVL